MEHHTLQVQHIREVLNYSHKFKNNICVIYIDDILFEERCLLRLVKDILHLFRIHIRVVIVVDARNSIHESLGASKSYFQDNIRIVPADCIEQVQKAAFDASLKLLNACSLYNVTVTLGNWITARGIGVVNGTDFLHAGKADKINTKDIMSLLDARIIPIIPAIGWSSTGKLYSLEAIELAARLSADLCANKLFYVIGKTPTEILSNLTITSDNNIDKTYDGEYRRIKRDAVVKIISENREARGTDSFYIFAQSVYALSHYVDRVHVLDGREDGILLSELFSNLGSGLMIYNDEYQLISPLQKHEIDEILRLMQPLIEKGVLLDRSIHELMQTYTNYVTYKADGDIYGIASLVPLDDKTVEIAGVLVNENYHGRGIGRKLVNYLIAQSKTQGYEEMLAFTVVSGDWFEKLGFAQMDVSAIPEARKKTYHTQKRKSRVYRYALQ